MQQQQDKEFDARLREKMQGFTVSPPPPVWESIDKEINGSASRKKPRYGWLKIAASIGLLAAAGAWLYQYRSPFKEETVLALGEQDSISSPGPSVTILNKSRSGNEGGTKEARQSEAGQKGIEQSEAGQKGIGQSEAGQNNAGQAEGGQKGAREIETRRSEAAQQGAGQGEPADTEAGKPEPEVEKAVRESGSPDVLGREKADKAGEPDQLREEEDTQMEALAAGAGFRGDHIQTGDPAPTVDPAPKGDPAPAGNPARVSDPVIAGIDPLWNPQQPTLSLVEPSATDGSRATVSRLETAGSETRNSVAEEFTADAPSPPNEQEEKKDPIVPEKIRELSGFGEALNLAASTIDRSRDKFIRVKKDEESGKWSGLRLDLGLVTISYNKPAEKNAQERNY